MLLIFLLGFISVQVLQADVRIYIDEPQYYIKYFDTITVAVNIEGLNTTPLRGYKINFAFDDYYLEAIGTSAFVEGDFLRDIGRTQFYVLAEDDGSYTVTCSILSVTNGAYGAGTLFYATLRAKDEEIGTVGSPGSGTDLNLSDIILRDPLNHNITYHQVDGGDVVISALPLYSGLKVFLQGPYLTGTGGTMSHVLSDNSYIPLTSPYEPALTLTAFPTVTPRYIVDWLYVELRATVSSTFEQGRSCFLLNDGTVVDLDGNPILEFEYTAGYDYYVVIRHRNHLAVMSADPATLSADPLTGSVADLTVSGSVYGGDILGVKLIEPGILALYAGDADQNEIIAPTDMNLYWRVQTGSLYGYYSADFDLNGNVLPSDRNLFWRPNSGRLCQIP